MKTAIALWCIVAVGCKQSPVIQQSSGYATMTVFTSEKTLSNNYSASIRGKQDIDIYPQVSGFITKLCVTEGESVKKGQVLFIIDQVPYQAALNTAIANVEAAKASVATAQLTYDSKQELYKQSSFRVRPKDHLQHSTLGKSPISPSGGTRDKRP